MKQARWPVILFAICFALAAKPAQAQEPEAVPGPDVTVVYDDFNNQEWWLHPEDLQRLEDDANTASILNLADDGWGAMNGRYAPDYLWGWNLIERINRLFGDWCVRFEDHGSYVRVIRHTCGDGN